MSWTQKNKYYLENDGCTICKYGGSGNKYGLFRAGKQMGFFMTLEEAKIEYERLLNDTK